MDQTLIDMMKNRDEIKKRLEEKQRLFELIQNPKSNNPVKTQEMLKKNKAVNIIQVKKILKKKYWRNYKKQLKQYEYQITEKEVK